MLIMPNTRNWSTFKKGIATTRPSHRVRVPLLASLCYIVVCYSVFYYITCTIKELYVYIYIYIYIYDVSDLPLGGRRVRVGVRLAEDYHVYYMLLIVMMILSLKALFSITVCYFIAIFIKRMIRL